MCHQRYTMAIFQPGRKGFKKVELEDVPLKPIERILGILTWICTYASSQHTTEI